VYPAAMKLLWLAEVLRGAGQKVQEVPGWKTRGRPYTYRPHGVLWHHTAGVEFDSPTSSTPSLRTVIEGRAGIPGPLSQTLLAPDGTWWIVAAGYANHAGRGSYPGISRGNPALLGVEVEESGDGDWIPEQLEALRKGTVAIMAYAGWDLLLGHKEWAPNRKVDPAGLDMEEERQRIRVMIKEEVVSIDNVYAPDVVERAMADLKERGILSGDHPSMDAAGVSLVVVLLSRVIAHIEDLLDDAEVRDVDMDTLIGMVLTEAADRLAPK